MSATSVCTITVNLTTKKVSYSAAMTIREKVAVTITGATGATAAGLLLRVLKPDDQAEMAVCDSFTASGDDFVGSLDLSGDDLADEFDGDDAQKVRAFMLQCWNNTDENEVVTDKCVIQNNPLTAAIEATTLTEA
jgi:hypothetical protein